MDPVTTLTSMSDFFIKSNLPFTIVLLSFISNVLLFIIVGFLLSEKLKLSKEIKKINEKIIENKLSESKAIQEIVDKYYEGNLKLVESFTEIKSVLISIQNNRR